MTTYVYDATGGMVRPVDPLGYRTTTTYDASGHPVVPPRGPKNPPEDPPDEPHNTG